MNGPHHSCRQRHVKPYARTDGCLLMRTPGHRQVEIVSAWDTSEHAQAYQRFMSIPIEFVGGVRASSARPWHLLVAWRLPKTPQGAQTMGCSLPVLRGS